MRGFGRFNGPKVDHNTAPEKNLAKQVPALIP